jgi:mono/diheme cytochrome c family protein
MRVARSIGALVVAVALLFTACSSEDTPTLSGEQADDAELVLGQQVYADDCARCHGDAGGGGAGPKLADGNVVDHFPDPAAQAEVIRDGRGSMPAWGSKLTPEEIDAVVRYTREVL